MAEIQSRSSEKKRSGINRTYTYIQIHMVGHTVENMDVAFSLRFKVFLQNTVLPGYRSRTDCYEVSLTTLGSSVWKQQLRLLVHSTCDWARIRFRSAPTVVVNSINTLLLPLRVLSVGHATQHSNSCLCYIHPQI